jgi:hypothetical protein
MYSIFDHRSSTIRIEPHGIRKVIMPVCVYRDSTLLRECARRTHLPRPPIAPYNGSIVAALPNSFFLHAHARDACHRTKQVVGIVEQVQNHSQLSVQATCRSQCKSTFKAHAHQVAVPNTHVTSFSPCYTRNPSLRLLSWLHTQQAARCL